MVSAITRQEYVSSANLIESFKIRNNGDNMTDTIDKYKTGMFALVCVGLWYVSGLLEGQEEY